MKCPKCGEEYKPGQSFCLRCGAPIYESDDTADVPGKTNAINLDAIKEATTPFEDIISGMDSEDVESEDMIHDMSRVKPVDFGNTFSDDDDEFDDRKKVSEPAYNKTGKSKKKLGKRNIVIFAILGILLIVVVVAITLLYTRNKNEEKYQKYYKAGTEYYDAKNYAAAATQYINAADHAINDSERVEVNEKLWHSYELLGGYDDEEISVLEKLIKIKPSELSYYEALIILYQNNDMNNKITELIDSVTDISIKESLQNFDGTIPNPNYNAGEYNKPLEISLSVSSDIPVYYTIDGSDATEDSKKYTKPIKLEKEGTYILKAISVDKNGKVSKQLDAKYKLNFTVVNVPVINLDSGKYETQKKISVTADPGCKIYYTKDGSTPDDKSSEYTEEIKMAKGNNVYSFVAINDDGVKSKVVTRVYDFEEKYEYSYDAAISNLSSALVANKTLENPDGEFENGDVMYYDYVGIKKIDKSYYYIVTGMITSSSGATVSSDTYAISCNSGDCFSASVSGSSYELSGLND